ncbi:MAG: Fe-S protein assembly chaperone HscA [Kofleriaceae bacterium]|nr:Fe-S protein assembly chaperone HscA [Kofleriaceae bacterium]MCL4227077.1 Fe-S protein assembly chaperone HscA [Myxococcales bacterium]
MLLQISEPGEAPTKAACKRRVVGIDLGTTNSLVAHVADVRPAVIAGDGGPVVPSVVAYAGDGEPVVGAAAVARGLEAPADTIASVKRLMGRSLADVEAIRALVPYRLVDDAGRMVKIALGDGRELSPVQVSAAILGELRRRAEAALGGPLDGAVITVPAYFDDAQRQATRDAGRLAGLEVLRLVAEPTAAALAYGLDRGTRGTYAVYDLGGGTFDVSILTLVDGVFEVRATGGDSALGGDDLDRAIVRWAAGDGAVPASPPSDAAARREIAAAIAAARAAKEALTAAERAGVAFTLGGRAIERTLTRVELAAICAPLFERSARACRRVLKDAGYRADELDGVVLVGGSTRSPVVRDHVRAVFGREPLCELDPDHVVALGAAVQADVLAGGQSDVVLIDVVPLSLGLETMGGVVEKLVARNSTIPCGATQTFTTYADNQTGFALHVVQGERETADACRSLARFTLRGVPPMVAGAARVEISFQVDADGILHVAAHEQVSGVEAAIQVKPSYGLTDEEVERMLLESFDHAEDDLAERNLRLERVEAERILAATRAAMARDPHLLDADVAAATTAAMAELERIAAGADHVAIRGAIEALDRASKPFAERRMNLAIEAAMKGRALDEVERELAGETR